MLVKNINRGISEAFWVEDGSGVYICGVVILMRQSLIIILTFFLSSCFDDRIPFEKDYYEKISGIKFPDKYEVLETFDNGEWLTGTVFKIDSSTLIKFVSNNHFDTLKNIQDIHLLSDGYFTKNKLDLTNLNDIYFINKSKNKKDWRYVVDLNKKILWAEISYPDWGGQ